MRKEYKILQILALMCVLSWPWQALQAWNMPTTSTTLLRIRSHACTMIGQYDLLQQQVWKTAIATAGLCSLLGSPVLATPMAYTPLILSNAELTSSSSSSQVSPKIKSALANIDRVYYSLFAVLDDINSKSDPKLVTTEVKLLLQNYHLKENFDVTRSIIAKKDINTYQTATGNVVDFLTQVNGYFEESIDDVSGRKFPPKEVLVFAQDAIQASQKEMKIIFSLYPIALMNEIDGEIRPEFPSFQ